jgi:Ferritin-like domain
MSDRSELSRRRLLQLAGLTSLGGVLVACGARSSGSEPGRVGNAPPIEQLPTVEIDDAVLVRTMTSMEYLYLDLYQRIKEAGALDDPATQLVDRFVEDHQTAADELVSLTQEAGGELYECANDWYTRRIVPDIFAAVTGDEAEDVAPSDDPANDLLRISYGFETMLSSAYQKVIELLAEPSLRPPLAQLGATAARHSAAVAMLVTGTPEGYVSPIVLGGELTPDESGRALLYAIPARFGSLTSAEIVIGAPNEAGTRANFALETPADNAYVYPDQTCEA